MTSSLFNRRIAINAIRMVLAASLCLLFSNCEKGPGTGGNASISGKVYVLNYRSYSVPSDQPPYYYMLDDQYYAQDELVFLVYGDDTTYSRTVRTRYDGTYYFDYLRKGKYKVYAMSRDTTATGTTKEIASFMDVEITGRKQNVVLDSIVILK